MPSYERVTVNRVATDLPLRGHFEGAGAVSVAAAANVGDVDNHHGGNSGRVAGHGGLGRELHGLLIVVEPRREVGDTMARLPRRPQLVDERVVHPIGWGRVPSQHRATPQRKEKKAM
jgi:L-alanine-DL-glutamate epimerase-like enolase superfamily enzyme